MDQLDELLASEAIRLGLDPAKIVVSFASYHLDNVVIVYRNGQNIMVEGHRTNFDTDQQCIIDMLKRLQAKVTSLI